MDLLSSDDRLYDALLARDPAFEGRAYVGVRTTGIFCRLTCPARKPLRQNTIFFASAAESLEAGFRPCLRCRPLSDGRAEDPLVRRLVEELEKDPGRRWSEADIIAMGLDPSTVRRAFRRSHGTTFLNLARLARLRAGAAMRSAGAPVIAAQLEAGFDSPSGFRAAFARLLGRAPGTMTGTERLKADFIDTPLGAMVGIGDDERLFLLEFADRRALRSEVLAIEKEQKSPVGLGRAASVTRAETALGEYFSGRAPLLSAVTAPYGTPFTRRVWAALCTIPPGETRSYADMARQIGHPQAVRAVARANGANRLALIVPCHRVIAADGSLSGYGGGVWRKSWLIAHEKNHFTDRGGKAEGD